MSRKLLGWVQAGGVLCIYKGAKAGRSLAACSAWENGVMRGLDGNEYRKVRRKLTRACRVLMRF